MTCFYGTVYEVLKKHIGFLLTIVFLLLSLSFLFSQLTALKLLHAGEIRSRRIDGRNIYLIAKFFNEILQQEKKNKSTNKGGNVTKLPTTQIFLVPFVKIYMINFCQQSTLIGDNMLIRAELESDRDAVYAVNLSVFETSSEANLVDALREQVQQVVSLVAEEQGKIVGHIMFSPVSLSGYPGFKVMGLGPMAVVLGQQRKGIGSALVRAGLEQCRRLDVAAVVVLGHSKYYPRFGFVPSSRFGIDSQYEVPEEVFMAIELQPEALTGKTGRVKYHTAFNNV